MPPPPPLRLLIAYAESELLDALPLLLASNSLPIKAARLEPAGAAFHTAALRLLGFDDSSSSDDTDDSDAAADPKSAPFGFSSSAFNTKSSGGGKKHAAQQDHYALLGLSHLRFLATEEQIRKAYREVALKHHPDKQAALILLEDSDDAREAKKQEIDARFKSIQEAYEVLVDPLKRRVYDSVDEFDDEIPGDCPPSDFFKVYGPVFQRNGRWSVVQPVPELGDDGATMVGVDGFYDFWYSFKSWREFPHADEFEIDQAEGREHKRWMERQNLKLREKAKKEESGRVRALVENAYKRDPRIVRRREEEKAEKLKKKEAKARAKMEREMSVVRAAEEERLRRAAEEKRAAEEAAALKKIKEKEKRLIRKERSRLRSLSAPLVSGKGSGVSEEDVETLCSGLDLERLRSLCESMEAAGDLGTLLGQALQEIGRSKPADDDPKKRQEQQQQQQGEQQAAAAAEEEEKKERERAWSKSEVELLRKAMAKYPKGTSQRWEVVSSYIGTGRSVEEILRAIKTVLLQKPDASKAFDTFLQKRKPVNDIASPLSTRSEGDVPPPAAAAAADDQAGGKNSNMSKKAAADDQAGGKNSNMSKKESSSAAAAVGEAVIQANGSSKEKGSGTGSTGGTEAGEVAEERWSEVQELALVKALKTFPKETAQRWERIAAAVPGKSKAQCFKKFAALRENFRSKK